jgi:hypothetical protein
MLRRPRKDDPRTDPFWEFGSFGCTGCHGNNLLHPKNCQIRNGDRLAFVQGGNLAPLPLVTPPVERFDHAGGSPKGRGIPWTIRNHFVTTARRRLQSPSPGRPGQLPDLPTILPTRTAHV